MPAKKAGMVGLGAAAGTVAPTPAAFAGHAPLGSTSPICAGGGHGASAGVLSSYRNG
jgi:hypothetical protein